MAEYRDAAASLLEARDALLAEKRAEMRLVSWVASERAKLVARLVAAVTLLAGAAVVLVLGPGTEPAKWALLGTLGAAAVVSGLGARRGGHHAERAIASALRTTDDVGADVERLRALDPAGWAEALAARRRGLSISLAFPAMLVTIGLAWAEVRAMFRPLGADARLGVRFHLAASTALLLFDAIRRARRYDAGTSLDGDSISISLRWIAGPLWGTAMASVLEDILGEDVRTVVAFYAFIALGVFLTLWVLPRSFGYRSEPPTRGTRS